jgi:hypothetical protein
VGRLAVDTRRSGAPIARTRRHAVSRNAGSATRLKRSTNRRSGSSVAHWCSLVCIRSTRASASDGVGHGAPVFTGDLLPRIHQHCEIAVRLRPVAGFPDLRLLRGLRPIRGPSADDGPARVRPTMSRERAAFGWFPRSPHDRLTGWCPAFPLQPSPPIRRRLSRWPPAGLGISPDRSQLPATPTIDQLLPGPDPPGFEPVFLA